MKRNVLPYYIIAIALIAMAACQGLGLQSPKTFNEKAAVAISSITAVRQSAITLLTANKITAADAQNIQDQANNARAGVEVAVAINETDPAAAENRISAVLVGLNAISAYLAKQGK